MQHWIHGVDDEITVRVQLNKSSKPQAARFCLREVASGKIGFLVEPLDQHVIEAGQHWLAIIEQDGHGYFKAALTSRVAKPSRGQGYLRSNKQKATTTTR